VNAQAILGVVCVYLLLGLSFMLAFSVIGRVQGGFFAEQADWTTSELVYFSYVTLTTLGYGDFTPATDVGRYAAVIEAIIGQVFLVVIVARFVSLWGREMPDVPTRSERREVLRERAGRAGAGSADDSSDESAASSGDD
jgi:voltage-gated potassium channel Kch